MKYIKLTQNKRAIVDEEDYSYLSRFVWSFSEHIQKRRQKAITVIKRRTFNMSDFLIDRYKKKRYPFEVTHKNKKGLDYRKDNLLVMSRAEMRQFNRKRKDNTSGYKGVWIHKKTQLSYAEIAKEGKRYRLGCFKTPQEAALAYNKKAKELYGEFAYQNKI